MNILLFIPFLVILFFVIVIYRRDKTILSFSGWILIIYLVSFLCSIILDFMFKKTEYEFESTLYFISLNVLLIYPFTKTKGNLPFQIYGNDKVIYLVAKVFAVLGIIAIIYYLPSIQFAFFGNLSVNRATASINPFTRQEGVMTDIMATIANLFFHNLFFYFYSIIKKWPKTWSSLMFISSLSFPALSLAWVGRDGLILWCLSFSSLYFLFRYNLNLKQKKQIKAKLFILLVPMLMIFLTITFSRFSNIGFYGGNPGLAMVDYVGQQYRNFVDFYIFDLAAENNIMNGGRATLAKLGMVEKRSKNTSIRDADERDLLTNKGRSLNVFAGMTGSLLLNFGKIGALVFGLVWYFALNRINNFSRFSNLFIYAFLYQIIIYGIFYYRLGIGYGDLAVYVSFLLFIVFRHNEKQKIY